MRKHPLFFFFFMAYAFSWIISTPYVLSVWGILPGDYTIAFILKPFVGPTLAAIIMTSIIEGKAGVRRLRDRRPMYAVAFDGKRYDTGDKLGFLKATVEFALARPDLADEFRAYLRSLSI